MTWTDPKSAWLRRQRRRVALAGVQCAGAAALLAGGIVLAVTIMRIWGSHAMPGPLVAVMLIPVAAGGIVLAVAVGQLGRERRIRRRVPQQGGLVCPKCLAPGPARDERFECSRCGETHGPADLRRYWEQYAFSRTEARQRLPRRGEGLWSAWQRRVRSWSAAKLGAYTAIVFASVYLLTGLGFGMLSGGVAASMRAHASLLLFGLGVALITAGMKRRIGDSEHCAACDYEKAPGEEAAAACPECGADWQAPGGTLYGRLRQNRALLWAGVAVAALYLARPFADMLVGRAWYLRVMPTSVLIDEIVAAPRGFVDDEWSVLRTRWLTPDEELELAEGLLEKRRRRGYLSSDDRQWLEDAIDGGRLPAEIAQRYER